jgi:hypothetical protein
MRAVDLPTRTSRHPSPSTLMVPVCRCGRWRECLSRPATREPSRATGRIPVHRLRWIRPGRRAGARRPVRLVCRDRPRMPVLCLPHGRRTSRTSATSGPSTGAPWSRLTPSPPGSSTRTFPTPANAPASPARMSACGAAVVDAVRALYPPLVFVENVAALLRRGFDVVHADLAVLGYDTRWLCLRTSDVGAAHRARRHPTRAAADADRARVRVENHSPSAGATRQPGLHHVTKQLLPTPTVADGQSSANATAGRSVPILGHAGRTLTDAARLLPTPLADDTGTPGRRAGAGFRPPLSQVLLPTPRASDGEKGCPGQRGSHGDLTLPSAAVQVRTLPTPRACDGAGPGGTATAARIWSPQWPLWARPTKTGGASSRG